jgi:autoinducer 2-degrading protein
MLIRVVKMTFREDAADEFLSVFDRYKERIRAAKGCTHLQLWRDQNTPNILFTYSHWESGDNLLAYRHSDTFAEVWPLAKALFSEKAEAWSVDSLHTA